MRKGRSDIQFSRGTQLSAFVAILLIVAAMLSGVVYYTLFAFIIIGSIMFAYLYLKMVQGNLVVRLEWSHDHKFLGETLFLSIIVENYAPFFMLHGWWGLHLTNRMNIRGISRRVDVVNSKYEASFMVGAKEPVIFKFEVELLQRGVCFVDQISLEIHDPFGIGMLQHEIILDKNEVVIYPKLVPVDQMELLLGAPMGDTPHRRSLHEDTSFTMGARPYVVGDPFNRVDWKTSARKNELHTKLYERTTSTEYVFIGNVHTHENRAIFDEERFERMISVLASLALHTHEKNVPFQILFNMRRYGSTVRIHSGEGRSHFLYTLESLARVMAFGSIPIEQAVFQAGKDYKKGRVFIVVTPILTEPLLNILAELDKRHIPIYLIKTDQDACSLQRFERGDKRYA